ncbi:alpha/beta fold hydrolase [Micromonospora sp. WMMD1102]|uniref:alpha/beta hydrolase family protein n=1 Tax=Micromonospora sp. WMMD1102 TaxID=3016105 RepID=UPI00241501CA|nr:alpha/beta fold hydrolase [Micromonospora sp. WMMD1102]MDG4788887.1 alpha/beta fold hydrolase [Micromonospora sp. WMMD1102]
MSSDSSLGQPPQPAPAPDHEEFLVDRDGDRIALRSYPDPVGAPEAPVVLVWPAMGVRASYYAPLAAALRAAGLAVVVADLRGTGASTPAPSRASRYGYAELAGDVGAVLASLKPRLDGRTTILLGHSLGGQAALLHLALGPAAPVDGLALVAVGLPYWRAYPERRRLGILAGTQLIHCGAVALGSWPGWGFGGRQARGVIRDWAYTARTGRFPRLDGVDAEAAVRRVRTPVLAVSVDHDQYTPHGTVDFLCGKLAAAPVRRTRYTEAESGARLDHFTWVRASAPVAAQVAAFAAELPPR